MGGGGGGVEFLYISRGLILSVVPRAVKTGRSPSSHWFCVRYEGTFSIYFVKRGINEPMVYRNGDKHCRPD